LGAGPQRLRLLDASYRRRVPNVLQVPRWYSAQKEPLTWACRKRKPVALYLCARQVPRSDILQDGIGCPALTAFGDVHKAQLVCPVFGVWADAHKVLGIRNAKIRKSSL